MAKRGTFAGVVDESGKLSLYNQVGYAAFLKHLAGKRVTLTVGEDKPTRSTAQSKYYWGVCVAILAEFTGYDKDSMHSILGYKFLRSDAEVGGETIPVVRSTTKLKTDEFEQYTESIRIWAASELGCIIPLPNEVL